MQSLSRKTGQKLVGIVTYIGTCHFMDREHNLQTQRIVFAKLRFFKISIYGFGKTVGSFAWK